MMRIPTSEPLDGYTSPQKGQLWRISMPKEMPLVEKARYVPGGLWERTARGSFLLLVVFRSPTAAMSRKSTPKYRCPPVKLLLRVHGKLVLAKSRDRSRVIPATTSSSFILPAKKGTISSLVTEENPDSPRIGQLPHRHRSP